MTSRETNTIYEPRFDGREMVMVAKFPGKYDRRVLTGIGHNVPQEAPKKFADAVVDVDTY